MRVVSLVPSATELLFALGLHDEIIGVTHECDYPPAALHVPNVTRDEIPSGLSSAEIDAEVRARTARGESIYSLDEELLENLRPELIVTQALCAVCAVSYDDVRAIADRIDTHPRVLSLDPRTLGEVLNDVRVVAGAIDREEEAEDLLDEAVERINRVRNAVSEVRVRPRVAALEWLDPVFVAGHWTPQLIEYAGGDDALGFAGEPSEQRTWEEVEAADPEIVVVMPCGYDAMRSRHEAEQHSGRLAALGAREVVAVDASAYYSRPGPRLIDGLELMASILHPDLAPEPEAAPAALPVAV